MEVLEMEIEVGVVTKLFILYPDTDLCTFLYVISYSFTTILQSGWAFLFDS